MSKRRKHHEDQRPAAPPASAYAVDEDAPSTNAELVEVTPGPDFDEIAFTPGTHGGPEVLWFNLRIVRDSRLKAKPIRLVLKHFNNLLGHGTPANCQPVMSVDDKPFARLPPGSEEVTDDGQVQAVWRLPAPARSLQVATCFPYAWEEMEALLDDHEDTLRADTIGVSQEDLPIVRLSNRVGTRGDTTSPGIYLIARQHSGETPGSWVLEGFLRAIAEAGDGAPLVWAVPLSNVDGVVMGDYGKDNFPYDLNRAWGHPPMRHEALVIQRDMRRWLERCTPALAIDFHAPGLGETDGCYFFLISPERSAEMHQRLHDWTDAFQDALGTDLAATNFARVASYASRWETPSFAQATCLQFGFPALSLETPYCRIGDRVLTIDDYQEIGARLASVVLTRLRPS